VVDIFSHGRMPILAVSRLHLIDQEFDRTQQCLSLVNLKFLYNKFLLLLLLKQQKNPIRRLPLVTFAEIYYEKNCQNLFNGPRMQTVPMTTFVTSHYQNLSSKFDIKHLQFYRFITLDAFLFVGFGFLFDNCFIH